MAERIGDWPARPAHGPTALGVTDPVDCASHGSSFVTFHIHEVETGGVGLRRRYNQAHPCSLKSASSER